MLKIFNYNDNSISFQVGKTTMINATQMAKPFGKRPSKWLELPSTKEFIKTYTTIMCPDNNNCLETVRFSDSLIKSIDGRNGGTWMHEDIALEFARWLCPAFAIWCNNRIKELLLMGKVENNKFKSQ